MIILAFASALFAAAAAQAPPGSTPLPAIAAPTPTAQFTATRGRLTFDRACRDFTVETLSTNAACAERVGRGETGPTIEVAIATIQADNSAAGFQNAVGMIQRAIMAEDHPAALYLAGSLLTTGEVLPPDYSRGVGYLERAVAGGNVAAADLLATLVLAGRGMPKDVDRGIALLELAAAGGMDGSATRLAMLYLSGREIPRDETRARAILESAAAVNVRGAANVLAMLDAEGRVRNMQLHPSESPAGVEVRQYRTFDNPAIPPAFGFTDAFQRVHYSAYSDEAVREQLERDYATLPTPYVYELARRLVQVSPERARGYFLLARMRMIYDARRCADPQAMEAINAWDSLVMPDMRSVLRGLEGSELAAAASFALEREQSMPAATRPWWVCYAGLASYPAAAEGPPPLLLAAESEWPRLRQEARDQVAALLVPAVAAERR